MIDTFLPETIIDIPFYSHCKENTIEISASVVNEVNAGLHYAKERECQYVEGDYVAAFVYVLTKDVHSTEKIWVSVPAILFLEHDDHKPVVVAKEYITLTKHGNGSYIFIQK